MAKTLKKGDTVEWNTSQGKTTGTVKKKLTSPTKIKGHKVAASKSNPEYLVESAKSGDKAAHKPESLRKVSSTKTSKKSKTSAVSASKSTAKKKTSSSSTKAKSTKSSKSSDKDDSDGVLKDFKGAVNMTARQIEEWLQRPESKEVGFKDNGKGESVGHKSGRRIIKLLDKKQDDLTKGDLDHMRKVVGYVNRHLAQRPKSDVKESNWRYSLMNWGHDPAKGGKR